MFPYENNKSRRLRYTSFETRLQPAMGKAANVWYQETQFD
jgi:hypothetical protein